ncbi:hypothetical protein CCHR01_15216 [Colletotrichum chrysophilum]|uniref:Ankyrin repeat protein n=1 Tax=Colletotrichum chrysophilum TaxID=1836956 RepID=A0AAD9A8P6_9PEZI|nr:hypothetical protein CCHR01_15216 [Colletotrichum chrysophilum]
MRGKGEKKVLLSRGQRHGAIHNAAMHGHTEVVKWLIQQGVSIFEDSLNICGCPSGITWQEDMPWPMNGPRTACLLAILHQHYTTAHVLMEAGAGVHGNQWMPNGITIWQEAV